MVGPPAAIRPEGPLLCLSHCRSHDYKLLIQKGRDGDGGYRGLTKTYGCTCQHATTNRMTALFNLRTSEEGRGTCAVWAFEPLTRTLGRCSDIH